MTNPIEKWAEERRLTLEGQTKFDDIFIDCYAALLQKDTDLEERTNQYHLACAKILSRDAIIEQLSETQLAQDVAEAEARIENLEAALKAITEPEGVYRIDKGEYMENVVKWCVETAEAALEDK